MCLPWPIHPSSPSFLSLSLSKHHGFRNTITVERGIQTSHLDRISAMSARLGSQGYLHSISYPANQPIHRYRYRDRYRYRNITSIEHDIRNEPLGSNLPISTRHGSQGYLHSISYPTNHPIPIAVGIAIAIDPFSMMANEMGTPTRPLGRQELSVPLKNNHCHQKILRCCPLAGSFPIPPRGIET